MELLKPIFVKRWVAENNYIEYVFDNNPNNNYKNDKYEFSKPIVCPFTISS